MTKLAGRAPQKARGVNKAALGRRLVAAFTEARAELVSTLYFLLGNYDDAQDACQDAFVKCWRTRDRLPKVRNLRAWIFRVGLNAAKDLQRNAWRRRSRPLIGFPPVNLRDEVSPVDVLADREALERVRGALFALRAEEKEVFLLRQNGSLTYEEIALVSRRPVGTVKTQMRSALQKLRQVLCEPEPDKPGSADAPAGPSPHRPSPAAK